MSEQNNIWPMDDSGRKKLSDERLMAYLDGKLSPAEQNEVEQWLAAEGMEGDALEGLRTLQPDETRRSVSKLNNNLRRTIFSKSRKRRTKPSDQFTWIAIVVILLLAVLAYIVVRKSIP